MVNSPRLGGRPRRSGVVMEDPREGIVSAAAELFAAQGFHATRMSQIAQASGLRQSSIYYWFRSKDEILREIMEQNRVSLTAARRLVEEDAPAAVRLYIVLYQDVVQMCSAPLDFFDLEEAAHDQPDVFDDFHADYGELVDRLRTLVDEGVRDGTLEPVEAVTFVRTALSVNEGLQHRFHAGGAGAGVHDLADSAAWTSVRSVLADVREMDAIRSAARAGVAGFTASPGLASPRPPVGR
ncbi:TetR/AcrR family transcriptional regulator [Aeromicrobium phragmitis]|uniref:TetR/AcrR family transcriptional regulator n=1 Tax=Aeromicrobium phragmitis TaxID=2478914 RepID=A0A3L8PQ98_9ACTN|nr:TetR/AcrR family transcriptional regulator [Aeromicrobium phragmitis]RLV57009.1 TetR/AcrR family transcriptional regulator [Aeromicrobium phragmitis]